ncbi:MAG: hypothetical protein ACRC7N_00760 [Clostridium sp.]
MNKKIIIFGISALLLICGVTFYEYYSEGQIKQVMSVFTSNMSSEKLHILEVEVDYKYKNFNLKLEVDNSTSNEKIDVVIKNPKGEKVESFEVLPFKVWKFEQRLKVFEGKYLFEFNKEGATSEYFYKFECEGNNE